MGRRRSAGCAACSPSPAGTRSSAGCCSPAIRWGSSRSTSRDPRPGRGWSVAFASELRALLASGLLGTPRLDPQAAASVRLERLRRRPRHGRQGRRAALAGPAARVRRRRQGDPQRGLLAHPRAARPIRRWTRRSWPRPRGGAEAAPRQRRAAGGLPVRRRRLVGDGQPGAARRQKSDPHLHARLRGAGAQRRADRAADRRRHRHRAPRGGAHRGSASSATWRRRSTAWTSRPSTG